jgi:hypothetical protein
LFSTEVASPDGPENKDAEIEKNISIIYRKYDPSSIPSTNTKSSAFSNQKTTTT